MAGVKREQKPTETECREKEQGLMMRERSIEYRGTEGRNTVDKTNCRWISHFICLSA